MNRKVVSYFLIVFMCLLLIGCGKKPDTIKPDTIKEDDNQKVNNDKKSNVSSNDIVIEDDLQLYSDDTKLVFQESNITYVFYYSGDKITNMVTYINYENEVTANYARELLNGESSIKKAYVEDKYLVVEYNESEYKDLTVNGVKAAYSLVKEVTK